jgi:hypothetical protein
MVSEAEVLRFPDAETLADLVTFVGRARRVDPDGAARLAAHGDVLAVWVSPVHGAGGPLVLGMRTVRLAGVSAADLVVPLATLADALARARPEPDVGGVLVVPPEHGPGVAWAGTSPPRRGWTAVGDVDADALTASAAAGVAEIVAGSPPGAGAAAVATLRARVWGRPLVRGRGGLEDLPAGVAFVAEALGFVASGEQGVVYRSGPWWRVTTRRGHVLARRPVLG